MVVSLFKTIADSAGAAVDIPDQQTANEGDIAFDQATGQRLIFKDVSTATSFSYGFNGNSGIEVDDSITNFFDSTKRFSQQFSTFITSQSSSPLLSYNLNNVGGNATVTSTATAPAINLIGDASVQSFSPYLGNSLISDSNQPNKEASIFLQGAGSVNIESAGVNFTDSSLEDKFTISSFVYDIGTKANQPIASTSTGSLVFKQGEVIQHGLKHKLIAFDSDIAAADGFTDSTGFVSNGIMPSTSLIYNTNTPATIKDTDKWEHNALVSDGYDINVFKQGVRHYSVSNPNFTFDAGLLKYRDFERNKNAAFSAKVFFPSSPGSNATLFTMGNGSGNVTSLVYTHVGQTITFTCRQLSFTIDAASLFTGVERVVMWDIHVNPAGIRLFIDGQLKGQATSGSPLTNFKWAEGSSGGILEEINPSGTTYQQAHYISTNNNLVDAAQITDGNVLWNSTLNDVGTFFILDNLIGNNKLYYFETEWIGGNYQANRNKKYYTELKPYLVNSGWDGSETYPANLVSGGVNKKEFSMFEEFYYGTRIYPNTSTSGIQGNPITNKFFMLQVPRDNYIYSRYVHSTIINFSNGTILSFRDGVIQSFSQHCILPDQGSSLNSTLGSQRTSRHANSGTSFLPSYALNETTFKLAFGSIGAINYAPVHGYGIDATGRQFIRSTQPDVEMRFNSDTWKYDPAELIINVAKPQIDNTAGLMGTGNFYPTASLPVNGLFASGGSDNWFTVDGSYKPLKYYRAVNFVSFKDQDLRLGNADLKINPQVQAGGAFASEYAAKHGGNIISLTGGGNITSNIQAASDNDVIKLGGGSYSIDAHSVGYFEIPQSNFSTYERRASSVFLGKKILICGDTNDPSEVIVDYEPYYEDTYAPAYSVWNSNCNEKCGLAFLTLKRDLSAFNHNRIAIEGAALHYFSNGGFAEKVIFDFTDTAGVRSNPYPGFMYSFDDRDQYTPHPIANRVFHDVQFKGMTRQDLNNFYAASYTLPARLSLHNIAYDGPAPPAFIDHHTGNTIQSTTTGIPTNPSDVIFTDSSANVTNFNGYLNGPELRKQISFDSTDFRNSPLLSNDSIGLLLLNDRDSTSGTSNRSFRIQSNAEKKQLLRIEDDGKVLVAKNGVLTQRGSFNIPTDTWTHVSLSIDPTTNVAKLRKDGTDVDSINNFFDSHFISDTKLIIGGGEDYTAGQLPGSFEKNYLAGGNAIKDFELSDSDITNDSVPVRDVVGNSKTRLLVANDPALDIDALPNLTTIAGPAGNLPATITGDVFSPYIDSDRKFFITSITNPAFNNSQIGSIGDIDNEILVSFPSSYASGLTDSPDFNVLLTLAQTDGDHQPIKWSYVENNSPRRAIIGHDSAGYKFQIKKFKYDSGLANPFAFENTASFTFNPSRIGSDSAPTMLVRAGSSSTVEMGNIVVTYDRFSIDLVDYGQIRKYIDIQPFDSDANQLLPDKIKFVYDDYPHLRDSDFGVIPGTSVNISQIKGPVFELDSIGALP